MQSHDLMTDEFQDLDTWTALNILKSFPNQTRFFNATEEISSSLKKHLTDSPWSLQTIIHLYHLLPQELVDTVWQIMFRIRMLFYLVWPTETMFSSLDQVPRYVTEVSQSFEQLSSVASRQFLKLDSLIQDVSRICDRRCTREWYKTLARTKFYPSQ